MSDTRLCVQEWRESVTSPAAIGDCADTGRLARAVDSRPPTAFPPAWNTVTSDTSQTRVRRVPVLLPVLRSGGRRSPRSSGAGAPGRFRPGRGSAREQLDLDRVHRVDVRVPQLDRAAHHRVALEQLVAPRRSEDGRDRQRVLPCERAKQPGSARRDERRGTRGRSRRLDLASVISRFRERRKNGSPCRARAGAARARRTPCRSRTRPAAAPGSASTRTPTGSPAATRGIRRRSGRRAGREPISSSASSSTGVKARKNSANAGLLPDEAR